MFVDTSLCLLNHRSQSLHCVPRRRICIVCGLYLYLFVCIFVSACLASQLTLEDGLVRSRQARQALALQALQALKELQALQALHALQSKHWSWLGNAI